MKVVAKDKYGLWILDGKIPGDGTLVWQPANNGEQEDIVWSLGSGRIAIHVYSTLAKEFPECAPNAAIAAAVFTISYGSAERYAKALKLHGNCDFEKKGGWLYVRAIANGEWSVIQCSSADCEECGGTGLRGMVGRRCSQGCPINY